MFPFPIMGAAMRIKQVLIALDQLLNALIGGMADESISARAYRNDSKTGKRRWRIARRVIDALFFWEPEHCKNAYLSEIDRRQYPPSYREQERAGA